MSDGAHLGVTAHRALDTTLGDMPSPEPKEGMSPEQMRKYILSKLILQFLDENPKLKHLETSDKIKFTDMTTFITCKLSI